ncbi:MAG TPA: hypothetical protein VGQ06_08065 [Gemmatimonadales bacterium]|nr:hypothetical protein [Gemmatimonadales bacterium]
MKRAAITPLRPVVLISTLAAATLQCAVPAGPSDSVAATVVTAERNASGIVRFDVDWRNLGAVPVYLAGCGGEVSMWLERRGPAWEGFGGGICIANLDQRPVRLDPGQVVRASVGVGPGDGGEYRAVTSVSDELGRESGLVRSPSAHVP